jgi:methionyl-tRNA synthetase
MKCPKCNSEARDIARFCPRCHATLRYECPACKHEQRQGGKCEKCGVDFLKYITAVMCTKKDEAELAHEQLERRSTLLKNILMVPLNMGIPLIRNLLAGSRKRSSL